MIKFISYLKKGLNFLIVFFGVLFVLFFFFGCKFTQSTTKPIVYEKKTTTIALVNEDEVYKYPQSDLKLAFLNDDRTYIVTTIDERYETFKDLLLNRPDRSCFYDVFIYNGEITSIENLPKEEQERLQSLQESSLIANRLSFKKDIRQNAFFWRKQEHPLPIEAEQGLSLEEINELYQVCDTLLTFNVKSSPVRSSIIEVNLQQMKGLQSYKLLLLSRGVNKVLKIAKKDSHMPEFHNWLVVNIYQNITPRGEVIWYTIDPYLFDKPITINELLKKYEESSDVLIKSYILSPNAYGFDYLNHTALYKI